MDMCDAYGSVMGVGLIVYRVGLVVRNVLLGKKKERKKGRVVS